MELQKIDLTSKNTPVKPLSPNPAPVKNSPEVSPSSPMFTKGRLLGLVIALGLGLGFGYYAKINPTLAGKVGLPQSGVVTTNVPTTGGVKEGDVFGVSDTKTFKDSVTGVLDKGGMNGEGSHKLLRPGGASQTVYLTSSVIDLDQFVGDEVTIWGETFSGQKVGWLMDVGRVKVEKLNAPLPEN